MQAQIDPAIYDAILQGGAQLGQTDPQIAYAQTMAKNLRAGSQQPGLLDAGRRVVAPSKWANLAAMVNGAMATGQDNNVMGLQQQQAAVRQAQVQQVLAALRQQQQPQQPPQVPGQPQQPNMGTPQAGV